jgi:hypothetical protein
MALYGQALANAGEPAPADALGQISGDLWRFGCAEEAIQIAGPRFDVAKHGLTVANNLITAYVEVGLLDEAASLVNLLRANDTQGWERDLAFWDAKISKKRLDPTPLRSAVSEGPPEFALYTVEGPVWLSGDSLARALFPPHASDAPWICFLGSSMEIAYEPANPGRLTRSDDAGRAGRAIPLFLAEQVHLQLQARVRVLVPSIVKPEQGFCVNPQPYSDEEATRSATSSGSAPYVVVTHVKALTEPWKLTMRLVRTADAFCVGRWECGYSSKEVPDGVLQLVAHLLKALQQDCGIAGLTGRTAYELPRIPALTPYLGRLEVLLAARFDAVPGSQPSFYEHHGAIDYTFKLCEQDPTNTPVRLILLELVRFLSTRRPELLTEYGPRLRELHTRLPLHEPADGVVRRMTDELLSKARREEPLDGNPRRPQLPDLDCGPNRTLFGKKPRNPSYSLNQGGANTP